MPEENLKERLVRDGDLFCSLLFDQENGTLRVVDFFGGNHGRKERYLHNLHYSAGVRKVFTLVEYSEVAGWRQVGFRREGTVPGYYKRTDAHVMSKIFAPESDTPPERQELERRAAFLAKMTTEGESLAALRAGPSRCVPVDRTEAFAAIRSELGRIRSLLAKDVRRPKREPESGAAAAFGQFGRDSERYYWVARHRRTNQFNVFAAEYQECFGNAKVSMYFAPRNRTGRSLACQGLRSFVRWLADIGTVAVFALIRANDPARNLVFSAAGFQSGGWLRQQVRREGALVDQVLWTQKLSGPKE